MVDTEIKLVMEANSLFPPRTGVGRSTERLLIQLIQKLISTKIHLLFSVFPLGKNWSECPLILNQLGIPTHFQRVPLPLGLLFRCWRYFNWPPVERFIEDAALIHGPAHVLPAAHKAAKVMTVHDTSLFDHPEWYSKRARQFTHQINYGLDHTDRVVVPSHAVKERLLSLRPDFQGHIDVVYHQLDDSFTPLEPHEQTVFRQKLFGQDSPYLFWSGEINPRKNVKILFESLIDLRKMGKKDLKLVMAGSLGYRSREELKAAEAMGLKIATWQGGKVDNEADVLLAGFVSHDILNALYASAEVFVFPSLDEGFGYPMLESMSCGVPVVCSNAGALPEISGNAAITADLDKGTEAFSLVIKSLLDDRQYYEEMRVAGFERQDSFRTYDMAEKIIQVYQKALKTESPLV